MNNTKFDQPDWESQLQTMMGERDAEELARKFRSIINEHDTQDNPVGAIEVALSSEEVVTWMHTVYDTINDEIEDGLRDVLWLVGLELTRIYLESDEIEPDEKCTDLVHLLWASPDDEADDDDDDDDD